MRNPFMVWRRKRSISSSLKFGLRTTSAMISIAGEICVDITLVVMVDASHPAPGPDADVTAVLVSTDGGQTWAPATLRGEPVKHAWRLWEFEWLTPEQPGRCILMARAIDSFGRTHDHRNLFVVGAPTTPTGGCTNGTLTFVALTLRSATEIARA